MIPLAFLKIIVKYLYIIQHHICNILLLYLKHKVSMNMRTSEPLCCWKVGKQYVKILQGLPFSLGRAATQLLPLSSSLYPPRTHLRVWAMSQSCESLKIVLRLPRMLRCFILSSSKVSLGVVGVIAANWVEDVSSESDDGKTKMNPVHPSRAEEAERSRCGCCQRTTKKHHKWKILM